MGLDPRRRSIISYDNNPEKQALAALESGSISGTVLPPNSKYITQALEYKLERGERDRIADQLIRLSQLESKPQVQLAAIDLILDRVEGKAVQQVKVEHGIDPQTAQTIAYLAEKLG